LTSGRVDPAHPTNRYFQDSTDGRRISRAAPPAAPEPQAVADGPPPPAPDAPAGPKGKRRRVNGKKAQPRRPATPSGQLELPTVPDAAYKNQVDVAKRTEETIALRMKNQKERGELIARETVKGYFGELQQIETTELLTLGEKLSPEIAALFGIDDPAAVLDVGKFIQKELSTTIEHIETKMRKFLKSFQVDEP
jgi:hypothetical protein